MYAAGLVFVQLSSYYTVALRYETVIPDYEKSTSQTMKKQGGRTYPKRIHTQPNDTANVNVVWNVTLLLVFNMDTTSFQGRTIFCWSSLVIQLLQLIMDGRLETNPRRAC